MATTERAQEIEALWVRELEDGRELAAFRMFFTVRLTIGPAGEMGYDDFWCYNNEVECLIAVETWDGQGDPPGRWHRHGKSGRRREWDGDTLIREWVQP